MQIHLLVLLEQSYLVVDGTQKGLKHCISLNQNPFVHVNNDPNIVDKYDLYRIEVPDEFIAKLDKEDLPNTWRNIPVSEETQEIGDEFLNVSQPQFAALQVPSIISPRDNNYVVNPNHPAMKESFKNFEKLEFEFDPRIFK